MLNAFSDGGAELGLLNLVENGFFAGHDFVIYGLVKGRGTVRERLLELAGPARVRSLSGAANLSDFSLPVATARLAAAFRTERPDLVILSLPQANLVGRIASLVVPEAMVVSFEHSMEYKRKVAHFLMAATASLVDGVFFDHPETWQSIRAVFPRLAQGAAHYVPLTFVEPIDAPAPIPEGRRHCVTTMRLEPKKNHAALFHAIRILLDRGYELDLTVAGEGPMRPSLERLIKKLGLGERVSLVGFVQRPSELLRQFDTYILSSSREGLSRGVIEAMAAGLVVVSTDVGGIRDYGVHFQNMIKATGTSPKALADAIGAALDLGRDARHLQLAALRTVERHFSGRVVRRHWNAAIAAVEQRMQVRAAT